MQQRHWTGSNTNQPPGSVRGDDSSNGGRGIPSNPPERTERIERIVERVVKEHGEALDKLADE